MARIEGVDLPRDKRVVIGLTYIFGIGKSTSQKLLDSAGIDHSTRIRDLSESELQRIRELIGSLTIEGDLRRQTQLNINRLMEINSYRGLRHRRRSAGSWSADTKTNGRTRAAARSRRSPGVAVGVALPRSRQGSCLTGGILERVYPVSLRLSVEHAEGLCALPAHLCRHTGHVSPCGANKWREQQEEVVAGSTRRAFQEYTLWSGAYLCHL